MPSSPGAANFAVRSARRGPRLAASAEGGGAVLTPRAWCTRINASEPPLRAGTAPPVRPVLMLDEHLYDESALGQDALMSWHLDEFRERIAAAKQQPAAFPWDQMMGLPPVTATVAPET
jgi:hypothetical protein